MRYTLLISMLLISPVIAAQSNHFTIDGKLENTKAKKVFLYIADIITGTSRADSSVLNNGSFSFKGNTDIPLKAILFSFADNNRLDFFIEPGTIQVYSKDSLSNAAIKAGPLNADFVALRKLIGIIETDIRNYNRSMQAALAASPEKRRIQSFKKIGI